MSFVFRKIFSKDKDPKTPQSAMDVTQSMIDFITDDMDPNDSFRSQQPYVDRSFDYLDDNPRLKHSRSETEGDFPMKRPKLNITSVLNNPKRGSIIEDLYGILQEQVMDQVGEMLQPKIKPVLSPKLLKQVQQKDFDLYIARLRKVYEIYKKNNAVRLRQKQKEQINMAANLLKCYEIVPAKYFEEAFVFNFEYLVQRKEIIMQAQEDLTDYMDFVEVNLYHQVTSKFEEYLDVLLKINKMEKQINNSLYSIRFFRTFNHELRNKFANKVTAVLKQKRRLINIEKTLALIDLINVVKKTLPTLVHLIQRSNFESAVKLVRTSEETYKTKLKQVKALKNFNMNFTEARSTLEKLLTSEFEDRCINYLSPALVYNKHNQAIASDGKPITEEGFIKALNLGRNDSDGQATNYPLYWTLDDFAANMETEKNIAKIIVEYIKIKDFPLTVYKGKLLEVMKKFHKKFMSDMNDYVDNITSQHNAGPKNAQKTIPFELHLKFILFYFETFKRFLGRHFYLNNKILSALVDFYNYNFVEKNNQHSEGFSYLQVLDTKSMKNLNETVQEFYLTLAMIFKYFNDRLAEVINLRSTENISIQQFTKLVLVFEQIIDYFHGTLRLEEKINSWIVSDKESIKKPLQRLVSTLSDKVTISPIQSLMVEWERNFLAQYHKKQLENIKANLEQEGWQAVEIPQEYIAYFSVFFEPVNQTKESLNSMLLNSDGTSESTKSSNLGDESETQDQSISSNLVHENGEKDEKPTHFSVNKNEFLLQGKKFQVTQSFLLLIQSIHDYIHIAVRFRFISLDTVSKIFEMIKFYNSYTIQLILGAGATTFGKIPRITAKILGLSSLSLTLLVQLIDPLYQTILKQDSKINQEWLNLEVAKVKHDLNSHISEIGAKIRSILKSKLIEQSNELKKLNWANAQGKTETPTKSTASILTNTKQMCKQIQAYLLQDQLVFISKCILDDIKNCLLPVYENINVETRIAAKRIKDELQYFNDNLYQIPVFQEPGVNYSDFEDKVLAIIEDKCNHFLEITSIN